MIHRVLARSSETTAALPAWGGFIDKHRTRKLGPMNAPMRYVYLANAIVKCTNQFQMVMLVAPSMLIA